MPLKAKEFNSTPEAKFLLELQDVLSNIAEDNFYETLDKINMLVNMDKKQQVNALCRNIFNFSIIRPKKSQIYTKLATILSEEPKFKEILSGNIPYAKMKSANRILNELVKNNIFSKSDLKKVPITNSYGTGFFSEWRSMDTLPQAEEVIQYIFNDDIDAFQNFCSSPDIILDYRFPKAVVSDYVALEFHDLDMIRTTAYFGATKCFKYLLMNGVSLHNTSKPLFNRLRTNTIMRWAVRGGNTEIIRLLEQNGVNSSKEDIQSAIMFHQDDIFDWLIERFPELINKDTLTMCVSDEYLHGLSLFDETHFNMDGLPISCTNGFYEVANFLIPAVDFEPTIDSAIRSIYRIRMSDLLMIFINSTNPIAQKLTVGRPEETIKRSIQSNMTEVVLYMIQKFPFQDAFIGEDVAAQQCFNEACKNGNIEIVKLFIDNDIDINVPAGLTEACSYDNVDLVMYFLSCSIKFSSFHIRSAIDASIEVENFELVKLLASNEEFSNKPRFIDPLINHAFQQKNAQILGFLLAHASSDSLGKIQKLAEKASFNHDDDLKEVLFQFPGIDNKKSEEASLFVACEEGNLEIVQRIAETEGFDPNQVCKDPLFNDNLTPLMIACKNFSNDIVRYLLKIDSIDINFVVNKNNISAAYISCEVNNVNALKLLIEDPRFDPALSFRHDIPLLHACINNYVEIVDILVSIPGIDINKMSRNMRSFPLIATVRTGNHEILSKLLTCPTIDVNQAVPFDGVTPLMTACKSNDASIVQMLLSIPEIDVNKESKDGKIFPLSVACEYGNCGVVELLLSDKRLILTKNQMMKIKPFLSNLDEELKNKILQMGV